MIDGSLKSIQLARLEKWRIKVYHSTCEPELAENNNNVTSVAPK